MGVIVTLVFALLVFLIPATVIIIVNIIKNKIMFGDVDDAINEYCSASRFNPRSSLNKFLNAKMLNFGRLKPIPMRWLVFYSNYFLPIIALFACYQVISRVIQGTFVFDANSILYLTFTISVLFNIVIIRGIDTFSFYFNFLPPILLVTYISIPFNEISIFFLICLLPLIGLNTYYFIRRKDLFLKSLRQLKAEVKTQSNEDSE